MGKVRAKGKRMHEKVASGKVVSTEGGKSELGAVHAKLNAVQPRVPRGLSPVLCCTLLNV